MICVRWSVLHGVASWCKCEGNGVTFCGTDTVFSEQFYNMMINNCGKEKGIFEQYFYFIFCESCPISFILKQGVIIPLVHYWTSFVYIAFQDEVRIL